MRTTKVATRVAGILFSILASASAFADSADNVCLNFQARGHDATVNDCLTTSRGFYYDSKVVSLINGLVDRGHSDTALDALAASRGKTYTQGEAEICNNFILRGYSSMVVSCLNNSGNVYVNSSAPSVPVFNVPAINREAIGRALEALSKAQSAVSDRYLQSQIQSSIIEMTNILTLGRP